MFYLRKGIKEGIKMKETDKIKEGVHGFSAEDKWVKPNDPLLLDRLEWFRDQKLGIMMHWGPYSQLGIVESWALSDKDASWSRHEIDWTDDAQEFKRQYFNLNKTFNPIRFQPDMWADIAKEGGFKYLIFTTKHHDGFCMWDTNLTDYKITSRDCPFHIHKYADICKNLFDEFRKRDIAISAYFSKADWHSPYYWTDGVIEETSRNPTYDIKKRPWLWEEFVQFTHGQIMELMRDYGRIDVLWLDAGWVCPQSGQDLRLHEVVEEARKIQPWLIVADRTVGGIYENFITPEQTIPEYAMDIPWESCITLGTSFSFKYDDQYKSLREIIHLLIEVVAKGGNLALNIAPQPDGRLPRPGVERIKGLGKWLNVYGEAIYGTRICHPYYMDKYAFTQKEDTVYCFYMYDENEKSKKEIQIPYDGKADDVILVGSGERLKFKNECGQLKLELPDYEVGREDIIAHVFKIFVK